MKYQEERLFVERQVLAARTDRSKEIADDRLRQMERDFHRRWFRKFEEVLHAAAAGPVWLKDPAIASMVAESLHFLDERSYNLIAYSIMSNHVHVVFKPLLGERDLSEIAGTTPLRLQSTAPTLSAIMDSLKGFTARKANKMLGRKGTFWDAESYDHEIRTPESMARIIRYVLNNPVKAGLVQDWREWPWNFRAR